MSLYVVHDTTKALVSSATLPVPNTCLLSYDLYQGSRIAIDMTYNYAVLCTSKRAFDTVSYYDFALNSYELALTYDPNWNLCALQKAKGVWLFDAPGALWPALTGTVAATLSMSWDNPCAGFPALGTNGDLSSTPIAGRFDAISQAHKLLTTNVLLSCRIVQLHYFVCKSTECSNTRRLSTDQHCWARLNPFLQHWSPCCIDSWRVVYRSRHRNCNLYTMHSTTVCFFFFYLFGILLANALYSQVVATQETP